MKKLTLKRMAEVLMLLLIITQFFAAEKNISSVTSENAIERHYTVPPKIRRLLRTSCNDCHSNNTKYPWYNKIQPVRWWSVSHVKDGKRHLNFDEFNTYTAKKLHKLEEVA